MKSKLTYRDLKAKLEELMSWFNGEDLDVDEAMAKHAEAEMLIVQLEAYLNSSKNKLPKSKGK
jgi:exonuclease VII small subunit